MKIKKAIMIFFISFAVAYSAESKILNTVQNWLPTWPEVGYLSGIANVYVQTNQFVRSSAHIVRNVKRGREQLVNLGRQLDMMYETLKNLKHINPYDMDTWLLAISDTRWVVTSGLRRAVNLYDNAEYLLLDGSMEFFDNIKTEQMYKDFARRNDIKINDLYMAVGYKQATVPNYTEQRGNLTEIQNQLLAMRLEMPGIDSTHPQYDSLLRVKRNLEDNLMPAMAGAAQADSVIREIHNLLAINVTTISEVESRLGATEEVISDLMDSYFRLINGNVRTIETPDTTIDVNLDLLDGIYGNHPNQVPVPQSGITASAGNRKMHKKEPDQQDALSLQNNAGYLQLKQDALYRDILAMKINTIAFVVALEALNQYKVEEQVFRSAASLKTHTRDLTNINNNGGGGQ